LSQNLRPISLLPTTGKPYEKLILNIVQRHTEERGLLNASQFGFHTRHCTTLQSMRLTDVTLNFNNNMSMASVFLVTDKAFGTCITCYDTVFQILKNRKTEKQDRSEESSLQPNQQRS
jgi:hypothetical protein